MVLQDVHNTAPLISALKIRDLLACQCREQRPKSRCQQDQASFELRTVRNQEGKTCPRTGSVYGRNYRQEAVLSAQGHHSFSISNNKRSSLELEVHTFLSSAPQEKKREDRIFLTAITITRCLSNIRSNGGNSDVPSALLSLEK